MPITDTAIVPIKPAYIRSKLRSFNNHLLKGHSAARLECLVKQIADSTQRINHITNLRNTIHSPICTDATREDFNPLKAAAYHSQNGNVDEAFWLVFLATHFGEDEHQSGHRLVKDVYCGLGNAVRWDWKRICSDPNGFRQWLKSNKDVLQKNGRFGNHRKYESLLDEHTGKTIASYIEWIGPAHKHLHFINGFCNGRKTNSHILFDALYKSMEAVWRFGRTGKFDYLSMVGKLGLADIEPGHPYLQDATGPLEGARLLFGNGLSTKTLNTRLWELGLHLDLYFSMQALEDSICNWHKSPDDYISFLP